MRNCSLGFYITALSSLIVQRKKYGMPVGYLLDLWECHKQFLGLAKPKRMLTIDDVIPYEI